MKVDRDKNRKRRPFSGVPAAPESKGPMPMMTLKVAIAAKLTGRC
jgi:hypothetical protein